MSLDRERVWVPTSRRNFLRNAGLFGVALASVPVLDKVADLLMPASQIIVPIGPYQTVTRAEVYGYGHGYDGAPKRETLLRRFTFPAIQLRHEDEIVFTYRFYARLAERS